MYYSITKQHQQVNARRTKYPSGTRIEDGRTGDARTALTAARRLLTLQNRTGRTFVGETIEVYNPRIRQTAVITPDTRISSAIRYVTTFNRLGQRRG